MRKDEWQEDHVQPEHVHKQDIEVEDKDVLMDVLGKPIDEQDKYVHEQYETIGTIGTQIEEPPTVDSDEIANKSMPPISSCMMLVQLLIRNRYYDETTTRLQIMPSSRQDQYMKIP